MSTSRMAVVPPALPPDVVSWLRASRSTEALMTGLRRDRLQETRSGSGAAIEVRGLCKSYGSRPVLRGIDLTVDRGEVFCLLGPNGAGKTTTVEILEGFRSRTAGD